MKLPIAVLLSLLLGSVAVADVFYLHADMSAAAGKTPLDKSLWFDDPVGGSDMNALGASFAGNTFNLNGKDLTSDNTGFPVTFPGTFAVDTAGTVFELFAHNWTVAGMDVDALLELRLRQVTNTQLFGDVDLGSSGTMRFRSHNAYLELNLSITNSLTGSGNITFGHPSVSTDTNALWNLSINDPDSDFSGNINLVRGRLTFGNNVSLAHAALIISLAAENSIVLADDVAFNQVTLGATTLTNGTYTAAELNTAFGTDRFSGPGDIVIPEPATIGMLGLGVLSTLMLRRMSRVRWPRFLNQ